MTSLWVVLFPLTGKMTSHWAVIFPLGGLTFSDFANNPPYELCPIVSADVMYSAYGAVFKINRARAG